MIRVKNHGECGECIIFAPFAHAPVRNFLWITRAEAARRRRQATIPGDLDGRAP